MTPEVMSAIGDMREHRGKQALYEETRPDVLESLVEVAKIQSTGASNGIESISTTDKRLRDLMADKTEPKNRDERQISGLLLGLRLDSQFRKRERQSVQNDARPLVKASYF